MPRPVVWPAVRRALSVVVALVISAAACNGNDTPPPSTTSVPTTTAPARTDDGLLRLGVLLPASGPGADIGQPTIDAVRLAVGEINAAGGVNGRSVELVVRDEGSDVAAARRSLEQLLAAGVDAVVGPASSAVTLGVLHDIVGAGVVACSPTAASLALDDYPDDNLFFRTIPSDTLQAVAIARTIESTGRDPVTIAYIDDAWGRPYAEAVTASLRNRGIDSVTAIPFAPTDDALTSGATLVADSRPGVVAVIGDADSSLRMASLLGAESSAAIVLTDTARRPASANVVSSMPAGVRNRIVGVSPTATPPGGLLGDLQQIRASSTGLYGVNAYDCTNLIALAAAAAGSSQPRSIAAQLAQVSTSGSSCNTFATCLPLLEGDRNIDYDGPGAVAMLGPRGDTVAARFDRYVFDDTGRDRTVAQIVVSNA